MSVCLARIIALLMLSTMCCASLYPVCTCNILFVLATLYSPCDLVFWRCCDLIYVYVCVHCFDSVRLNEMSNFRWYDVYIYTMLCSTLFESVDFHLNLIIYRYTRCRIHIKNAIFDESTEKSNVISVIIIWCYRANALRILCNVCCVCVFGERERKCPFSISVFHTLFVWSGVCQCDVWFFFFLHLV